jgi:hypothetical protein
MTEFNCDGSKSNCIYRLREYQKLVNRWEELKNWVADTGITQKESPNKDYQIGHNEALEGILWYMRKLEGE